MKNTTLSRQKTIITVFGILAILLLATYLTITFLIKEPLNTVYKLDKDGDELYATIIDSKGIITKSALENFVASGKRNKFDAKKSDDKSIAYTFRAPGITISYRPFIIPEIPLDKLSKVTVENDSGSFTAFRDNGTGQFLFEGAELMLYNSSNLSGLLLQSRYMLSSQKLENPSKDLSVYGLSESDSPVKITVVDTDGKSYCVLLGSKSADGKSFYMKRADKSCVFTMDSTASVFLNSMTYYLSPIITPPLEENEYSYIDSFELDKNGAPFIKCKIIPENERAATSSTNLHRVTYPGEYPASMTNFYDAMACFKRLTGTAVLEYNVSKNPGKDELFSYYGLNVPSNEIRYSYGGKDYRVLVGSTITGDDGVKNYYVYSPYMDTIVTLPSTSASFLDYSLLDFIDENVFQCNINNVKSLSVTTPEASASFDISGSGKDLKVSERSGRSIDLDSFRQTYISLLSIKIEGSAGVTSSVGMKQDLTFTVETTFGETYTYSFYTLSTVRCFMTVDGKGEFYTNRDYIDKIAQNLDKLIAGEKVPADF